MLATNRLDALDEAVLRRMDAKIRFEGLTPAQLHNSFVGLCEWIATRPNEQQLRAAAQLKGLTPGDFACLRRRLAFAPIEMPIEAAGDYKAGVLLDWLREELRHKTTATQPIGFYQSDAPSAAHEDSQAVLDDL